MFTRGMEFDLGEDVNALRDTVSDRFLTTYPAGQPRPDATKLEAVE